MIHSTRIVTYTKALSSEARAMTTKTSFRSPAAGLLTAAAVASVLALAAAQPGYSDDIDLLRFKTATPYLFIILDTSSSMNLQIGSSGVPVVGGGDNPNSRIYAAKQA